MSNAQVNGVLAGISQGIEQVNTKVEKINNDIQSLNTNVQSMQSGMTNINQNVQDLKADTKTYEMSDESKKILSRQINYINKGVQQIGTALACKTRQWRTCS